MKREILLTISFFILLLIANAGFSQTSISGVVNFYSAVDSIYPTKDTIEVRDPGLFSADDTIMIYQAKGAEAKTTVAPQPWNFGQIVNINEAGNYEIILVQDVIGDTVIFKSFLNDNYDVDGLVQLIKVPSYKSVSVDSKLTCDPWDGEKGGVLALMVSDTLFLNANIDVTGKGFRGADSLLSNGDCAKSDSTLYASQFFNRNTPAISAGLKGESIAKYDTTYAKGLGKWANGGGGGNARFSGGGGGANSGAGGYGGEEDTITCLTTPNYEDSPEYFGTNYWNALGGTAGYSLNEYGAINQETIFFGGGGGSGTFTTGLLATSGGNGGGIIIIMVKVIKSNGNSIIADGESVTAIAEGSAGGGGAGGTIFLDADSLIGDLTVSVRGGNGGRVQSDGNAGPGGGGGGGYHFSRGVTPNVDYDMDLNRGAAGYVEDLYPNLEQRKAKPGENGNDGSGEVPLTGFLFNSITPDQEVCMGQEPDLLYGSEPRGGDGTYTFEWKMFNDTTSGYIIPGATQRDYQPPALTDTTYFQRIVTSAGGTIVDIGNIIEIIVQNNIVNNQIFGDDTVICIGNEADTITGTSAIVTGGNLEDYNYTWQYSFDDQSWTTDNALNDTTYLHGIVTDTTLVRRIVQSGACYDTTTYVEIVGLPQISNNVLSADQEICYGQIPEPIIGEVHEGGLGLGTDSIYWQERTESGSWSVISDSSRKDFAPSNLVETMYYRRVIMSDDCEDFSDPVKVNVLPPIANNTITTESVIYTCYGTVPQQIIASEPSGGAGAGSYSYQWQESADAITWTDISLNATSKDYQPEALTDTTYFRRKVFSGLDDCCSSISDTLRVNIYVLPVAAILDFEDTICSGIDVTLDIDITDGKPPYIITYNDGFNDFSSDPVNSEAYNPVVTPETTNESEIFDYTLVSVSDDNSCEATDTSGLTKIHVYGNPVADAGIDDEACDLSYQLWATPTLGTGYWSHVSEIGNVLFDDINAASAIVTVDIAASYKFEWKEINWQCEDKDTVDVDLYKQLYNVYVNPQDTILYFVDSVTLKGSYINPDQYEVTSLWEMLVGGGEFSETENSLETTLTDLNDQGQNQISVTWTVSKRECEDTTVNVSIRLQELFTPTGFTPNGDGVNDYLKFNGIENSDEKQLIIYNRWGTEVYNKSGAEVEMGWDGKNDDKKDLPEDTYYYILIVTDDGVTQTHKGFIVLKRF